MPQWFSEPRDDALLQSVPLLSPAGLTSRCSLQKPVWGFFPPLGPCRECGGSLCKSRCDNYISVSLKGKCQPRILSHCYISSTYHALARSSGVFYAVIYFFGVATNLNCALLLRAPTIPNMHVHNPQAATGYIQQGYPDEKKERHDNQLIRQYPTKKQYQKKTIKAGDEETLWWICKEETPEAGVRPIRNR